MKNKFLEIYSNITRPGKEELLEYLEKETDFFTAPASSKFHNNKEGGLLEHSINVYDHLQIEDKDQRAVLALFHDLCKVNTYKVEMRNTKNEYGVWVKVPYYTINEDFIYGHGEKSVYLLSKFIKITDEEAQAIRAHMGAFDESIKNNVTTIYKKNKLALELHIADIRATVEEEVY